MNGPLQTPTSADWSEALGPLWRVQLVFLGLCLFAAGATFPLADPDLPIHLATGEWIVRHRAVPFVEPWAWTRPGAPFFAYSWAIETAYYVILAAAGPLGLHLLQGVIYAALGACILVLGRAAGWRAWTTIVVAIVHVVVGLGNAPYLRPQAILLVATPLTWALVIRARDRDRLIWELPALTMLSAIVANTHLLFPITAAPTVLLLTKAGIPRRRLLAIPLAIAVGWVLTPYGLHWIDVYRLYFAPNLMLRPPSPIDEYKPGFTEALAVGTIPFVLSVGFSLIPFMVVGQYSKRERLLHGSLWLAGLLMFALAYRALVIWWLLIIPSVGRAVEQLPRATRAAIRTTQRAAVVSIFVAISLSGIDDWRDASTGAGSVSTRFLPTLNAQSIEPIAEWLDCNVRHEPRGRLVTLFNYGGYVPWRLPYLSESIDGRTFFPDSVAIAETYSPPGRPAVALPPWRTADLAIAPVKFPVGRVLDTATGWRRVAITNQREGRALMIGLWVRETWWRKSGLRALPPRATPLYQRPPLDKGLQKMGCDQ